MNSIKYFLFTILISVVCASGLWASNGPETEEDGIEKPRMPSRTLKKASSAQPTDEERIWWMRHYISPISIDFTDEQKLLASSRAYSQVIMDYKVWAIAGSLPFIPKSKKEEEERNKIRPFYRSDKMEREWFWPK